MAFITEGFTASGLPFISQREAAYYLSIDEAA
jgi:hypothetical protein